ncbi:MAG: efflux RND transporter periplasmic adaptor subunit [Limnobacter sp.]|uniref:efflux RND transporter periplasmic adaptor subunit n=1 Tax=unclassified Limnobacter TaxID=2630203 RepID=UPI0014445786|nr:efflux RND transporter periplasmic adaptor subunit [Limnobacter sp. SAORIC-690]
MHSNSLKSKQTQASPYSRAFAGATLLPALLVTVLSSALLLGCGQGADAQAPGGPGAGQAAPVPVVEVKTQPLELTYEYPAQIAGLREVEIRARVAGIIERRQFEEGGRVKKGQSLYSLDNAPYQTALARALADENAAKVRAAQAERDYKRVMPLADSKAVSQSELDNAQSAFEVAKADLQVASAAVRTARLNLEYARVESPVNGFASRSLYSEGSFVSGPSELLTTVTQIDQVYVNFGIPEKDHEQLRKGIASGAVALSNGDLVVEVLGADGKPMGLKAKLGFQDVRVNPATGTVDARAVLANDKEVLSPGQFVRVRVSGAVQKNAVLLPQRAVLENPEGGKVVMTVSPENTVAPRPVQVAQWKGDQWVVTDGLVAGDKVMTDGFMKAPPGTPVQPVIAGADAQPAVVDSAAQVNAPVATEQKQ